MEDKISNTSISHNEGIGIRRKVTIPLKTRHSIADSDIADTPQINPYNADLIRESHNSKIDDESNHYFVKGAYTHSEDRIMEISDAQNKFEDLGYSTLHKKNSLFYGRMAGFSDEDMEEYSRQINSKECIIDCNKLEQLNQTGYRFIKQK